MAMLSVLTGPIIVPLRKMNQKRILRVNLWLGWGDCPTPSVAPTAKSGFRIYVTGTEATEISRRN
jgi:hypothetical protein